MGEMVDVKLENVEAVIEAADECPGECIFLEMSWREHFLAGDFSLEGVDLSLEMEKPLFGMRINSPPKSGFFPD